MIKIVMLLFENMNQLDFTAPFEVFSSMNHSQILLYSKSLDPVKSENNLSFLPDHKLNSIPTDIDILFVPGGYGVSEVIQDQTYLGFIKELGENARYISSVCTGSLILGAAGLLKGYRATSHWVFHELLTEFGAIPEEARVVIDRNRITGGGITAGIDIALKLVSLLEGGHEEAKTIQLMMEYNPEPPFQSGHPSIAEPHIVQKVKSLSEDNFNRRKEIIRQILSQSPTHPNP